METTPYCKNNFALNDFFNHDGVCSMISIDWVVEDIKSIYVHGPPQSGKTSLAMQYAFLQASRGSNVVVIMYKMESTPKSRQGSVPLSPCPACGIPESMDNANLIWNRIKIKYAANDHELRLFLASFHVTHSTTNVVIVDDLASFLETPNISQEKLLRTLALLDETSHFLNDSGSKSFQGKERVEETDTLKEKSGQILVFDHTHKVSSKTKYIYRRWFPFMLQITNRGRDIYQIKEDISLFNDQISDKEIQPFSSLSIVLPRNIQLTYKYDKKVLHLFFPQEDPQENAL